MHQVKNQPLLKFAWDVQNLIQTIESNNPDPGPMRSVWDTICMAMKQVNEPQVRLSKINIITTFKTSFKCYSPRTENTHIKRAIYSMAETSIINSPISAKSRISSAIS